MRPFRRISLLLARELSYDYGELRTTTDFIPGVFIRHDVRKTKIHTFLCTDSFSLFFFFFLTNNQQQLSPSTIHITISFHLSTTASKWPNTRKHPPQPHHHRQHHPLGRARHPTGKKTPRRNPQQPKTTVSSSSPTQTRTPSAAQAVVPAKADLPPLVSNKKVLTLAPQNQQSSKSSAALPGRENYQSISSLSTANARNGIVQSSTP